MKKSRIILIFVTLVVTFLVNFVCIKSLLFPKIELQDNLINQVSIGSKNTLDNIDVFKNNKKLKNKLYSLRIDSNIDYTKPGKYKVSYIVTYHEKDYIFSNKVEVIDDIKPSIELDKEVISYSNCKNEYKDDLGYKAIDNYDGDITDKVEVIRGKDKYKLIVKDSSNNETNIEVPSVDLNESAYMVLINGSKNQYVELNSNYKDDGASAISYCGEKIDKEIVVSGKVDTSKVGDYTLTYTIKGTNYKDSRVVHVFKNNAQDVINNYGDKIVYLTFDDGPGQYTDQILDILKKYNVKATFFVTAQFGRYLPMIEREAKEGHAVAVHTKTHNWNIYQSVDSYMDDFNQMNDIIEQYTGSRSKIFRFPGGSSNTISKGKSKGIMSVLASKMSEDGYVYFDWNVDSGDAAGASTSKIVANVKKGISSRSFSVVLMHDIKKNTLNGLEEIIVYGLQNGYTFEVLDTNSPTVHHHINN